MMLFLISFFAGFALSASLIVAIGAQNLFVLRQGLKQEHVGMIVLFCGFSDAVLIIAGVSGVGALASALPACRWVLRWLVHCFWHGMAQNHCTGRHTRAACWLRWIVGFR